MRSRIRHQIRIGVLRLEDRGVVRRVVHEPEAWWELAIDP